MLTPNSGLNTPLWHVAQFTFGESPSAAPSRSGGNTVRSGSRKLLFRSRTMRMPYHAVTRCGGLPAQSTNERVLWQ